MALRRPFSLAVDPAEELPLYLQLARGIADAIRAGRLRAGDALPGSRTMARSLGVNRNTVLSAYEELAAEGWVVGRRASGTFVAEDLPSPLRSRRAQAATAATVGFALASPIEHDTFPRHPPGVFVLTRGTPDPRLLPTIELARAYRRVLQKDGRRLLVYGDHRGHPGLRLGLAEMLSSARGLTVTADDLLVTRGSQNALDLIARALVTPGDVVAVEALGHPVVRAAFRLAGARLRSVPVDPHGACVGDLERLAGNHRIRAFVVTPHHQFPTTAVMPAARRMQLLHVAAQHRIAVIEDDYDHEFHYEGRPVLPLASADSAGVVIYVGTLSKVLAPGLRLGYVAAPRPFVDRIASIRAVTDIQGDLVMEAAVAELFASGELVRHVGRMRRIYRSRRDALVAAVRRELGNTVQVEAPPGGTAVWARVGSDGEPIDIDGWARRGEQHRVIFRSARAYAFDGAEVNHLRLGFTLHDEDELATAVRRMAAALPAR
ncbi:MocR-like pyridoxine biosynthesis transcription factor PdxR [Micromonospora sp. IBHARD004]|uniref:MocR-like pyridoxine biosynthesis transcription factor PdxR n=1 Tax=Micromonospora sp. IBHARD004 TaxID=3457764 RepID=UPI00405818A3